MCYRQNDGTFHLNAKAIIWKFNFWRTKKINNFDNNINIRAKFGHLTSQVIQLIWFLFKNRSIISLLQYPWFKYCKSFLQEEQGESPAKSQCSISLVYLSMSCFKKIQYMYSCVCFTQSTSILTKIKNKKPITNQKYYWVIFNVIASTSANWTFSEGLFFPIFSLLILIYLTRERNMQGTCLYKKLLLDACGKKHRRTRSDLLDLLRHWINRIKSQGQSGFSRRICSSHNWSGFDS